MAEENTEAGNRLIYRGLQQPRLPLFTVLYLCSVAWNSLLPLSCHFHVDFGWDFLLSDFSFSVLLLWLSGGKLCCESGARLTLPSVDAWADASSGPSQASVPRFSEGVPNTVAASAFASRVLSNRHWASPASPPRSPYLGLSFVTSYAFVLGLWFCGHSLLRFSTGS